MSAQRFAAVDLGASSGRVVTGTFDGRRLTLAEVHRFQNGPVAMIDRLYWDLPRLWIEVQAGLRAAATAEITPLRSIGVDTWGVDFGLLGPGDELLGNPSHYRDRRTEGMIEAACRIVPRAEIFQRTGLQFMPFNTLFQLLAMRRAGSAQLSGAARLLMIPDLFHWLLTGEKSNEATNASTTQCLDPASGFWADDLLSALEIPRAIFGPTVAAGTRLGKVLSSIASENHLAGVEVVLPATHDTASAVMAVPSDSPVGSARWCYISSGTWSLMGVELSRPVLSDRCRELNFTNEGGVGGTTRLLKNIAGLWLLQECRRVWANEGRNYSWEQISRMGQDATPFQAWVDPDDARFMSPGNMPGAIRDFCRATSQRVPQTDGEVIRTALESLALKYRRVLNWLEELTGEPIERIHIVGGGVQNRPLCQATADACGRPVVAGPAEATALGNVLVQAWAAGAVGSIAEAREVVRNSFDVENYAPRDTARWDEAYSRFLPMIERGGQA